MPSVAAPLVMLMHGYLRDVATGCIYPYCHGMTKSVKVHKKDQSVNKNANFTILASFVCFFNLPDRNLIILYKIT